MCTFFLEYEDGDSILTFHENLMPGENLALVLLPPKPLHQTKCSIFQDRIYPGWLGCLNLAGFGHVWVQ